MSLTFDQYIRYEFPEYQIDDFNKQAIDHISKWAARDKSVESDDFYLAKGLLLVGDYGTGKTNLMYMLSCFLKGTQLAFTSSVLWSFAAKFSKDGYDCLDGQEYHNRFYDELCLVDSRSSVPQKEIAQHYGNKILIGEEIIMKRYDAFKYNGVMTHFTSNANYEAMTEAYGGRAASRIREMCNTIILYGNDRRGGAPVIIKKSQQSMNGNLTKPTVPEIPIDAVEYNIKLIEEAYQQHCANEKITTSLITLYNLLKQYNVELCTKEDEQKIADNVRKNYVRRLSKDEMSSYQLAGEKELEIAQMIKAKSTLYFFDRMQAHKCTSIFGEVDASNLLKQMIASIKSSVMPL